jgi:hypothetical protein
LDGDGKLTFTEMQHFYKSQLERITASGQDGASFNDVLCQMVDYIWYAFLSLIVKYHHLINCCFLYEFTLEQP